MCEAFASSAVLPGWICCRCADRFTRGRGAFNTWADDRCWLCKSPRHGNIEKPNRVAGQKQSMHPRPRVAQIGPPKPEQKFKSGGRGAPSGP